MATATKTPRVPLKVSRYWPAGRPGNNYAQAAFLAVNHREVLYGGAAGPGKTVGLFMAALQYVDVPGYSAILMRRTYKQLTLPGQLLDIARDTLRGTDAKWVEKESRFEFPSGAKVVFGHLDSDRDLEDAVGPEYQFIGFDELTQFPEHHYRELFARLRRPSDPNDPLSSVPLRVRAASNPGGSGHRWVKQRFMVEVKPSRLFIPGRLSDNPGIDAESYVESLEELTPHRRRQLLDGDWDAKPVGAMFDRDFFPIVDPADVPPDLAICRYWDTAATLPTPDNPNPDWTASCLLGWDPESDDEYLLHIDRFRDNPGGVKRRVGQVAMADGVDIPVWFEQEPGSAGKQMIAEWRRALPNHTVTGLPSMKNKVVRAEPVAGRAENGSVFIVAGPWVSAFVDEAEDFPPDAGGHDDQVDAVSGAHAAVRMKPERRRRRYRVKPVG